MFRIRRAYWSGHAVLQVSDGDEWRDADVTPLLQAGFSIVAPETLDRMCKRLAAANARIELYERRAEIARRSRQRKKVPVLPVLKDALEVIEHFNVIP